MQLIYTLTLVDFKDGIRLHKRQKLGRRILFFIYDAVIPSLGALALVGMITAYWSGNREILDEILVPFAAIVTVGVFSIVLRALRVRKAYKQLFPPGRQDRNWSMEIDDEGLLYSVRGVVDGRILWSGVFAVAQDDRIVLIYISETQYMAIPASTLSSERRTEFNALVARHVVRR